MSMTGSLMGYENNNEINQIKCKKSLKTLPIVTTNIGGNGGVCGTSVGALNSSPINSSTATNINCKIKYKNDNNNRKNKKQKESCNRGHANGLWSVWYGILAVCLQAYVATRCAKRFVAYLSLPWTTEVQPPKFELHACIVLTGTGVLLLPILLAAAFLKLGNLANDGIKLGRDSNNCSRDSTSTILANGHENSGLASNLWKHGGPTAAFVHLCTAMCFLLPSLLMEARLIRAGFLPKDAIWQTDLDFIVQHRDRLVFVDFLNPQGNLSTLKSISQSYGTSSSPPIEQFEDNYHNSDGLNFDDFESLSHETSNTIISTTEKSITPTVIHNKNEQISNIDSTTPTKFPDTISTSKIKTVTSTSTSSSSSPTKRINANSKNIQNRNSRGKLKAKKYGQRVATTAESQRNNNNNNNNNMTGHTLALSMNSLSDLDHPEQLNLEITDDDSYDYSGQTAISLEYLNYAMALGVYSVRYPAVFWSCNKVLGTIFSIQLVINSVQSLIAYSGMSILYKIQVVGPHKVLQLMRQRRIYPTSMDITTNIQRIITNLFGDNSHLILNPHVTLALFVLSTVLVLCSSMVTYLYAYGRFASFLEQEKERNIIMAKERKINRSGWTYFTHCAALCVFLAIAICNAPLLYDYTVVYRGSLDGAILFCIISTVLHLFIWLILWFFLTIKRNWIFKVRVIISTTTLHSARTVKLVTDVDLLACKKRNNNNSHKNNNRNNNNNNNNNDDDGDNINESRTDNDDDDDIFDIDNEDCTSAPLLVVGDGKTYSIAEALPKKAIMNVIHRAVMEKKSRQNQDGSVNRTEIDSNVTDDEQIYWLRPKLRPSPAQSPSGNGSSSTIDKSWLNKKLRQKVTFNDLPSTSNTRNKGKRRGTTEGGGPEDDGDYATLRELPLMTVIDTVDDSTSEENKLLECVNDDQVTYYASGNHDLQPSEGDPSPLLTPEPLPDPIVNELTALNTSNLPPPIVDDDITPGSFGTTVISTTSTTTCAINSATIITATAVATATVTTTSANNATATSNLFLPQQPTGNTPRCLRRGDSGMPHDELTPRSDSSNSETIVGVCPMTIVSGINYCDAGSSSTGNSNSNSNTSSNSETSSGVHSNISNVSQISTVSKHRRATSVDDIAVVTNINEIDYINNKDNNHWRSCSLQRGSQPPNINNIDFVTSVAPSGLITSKTLNSQYAVRIKNNDNLKNQQSGCPAVILENANEATVVIRRKLSRPKPIETNNPNEFEPFSRSTNMRMTSFTENSDLRGISGIHSSSATLPHYPTQPVIPTYPHCSTMPLPHGGHSGAVGGGTNTNVNSSTNITTNSVLNGPTNSLSCGSVLQQQQQQQYPTSIQQQNGHTIVQPINHTTLPSHHNGMRIIHSTINNNYVKRYPQNNNSSINTVHLQAQQQQNWSLSTGHHTFPQLLQNKIFSVPSGGGRHTDRDSANFSMASSGDSDICIQHH
ncbi:protein tincar isoform X2 [Aphidius gifuensis]|uniref:protein tincar isoform X2 n=1 Tax=Aphidius gifuensis TaxID=684658 RepID=UPI001CDD8253|nr:protein tincar isoform X2 [Aphidius gifuensis]